MSSKPVGVALVGLGVWSQGLAGAMERSQAYKIVTCFTRTKAKRDAFAADYKCDQESSYEDVLKRKDVEAIVLVTPNNEHGAMTAQAAEHGKHVLVEKPIANKIEDAKLMIEACRKHGVLLGVCHNQRRLAGYRKMKAILDTGELGKLAVIETNFTYGAGYRYTPDMWRWYEEGCPGGPMMTMGVHFGDTAQYLAGPVKSVSAFYSRLVLPVESIDVGAALLKFESGALGYLSSNFITPWVYYCNIYGTDANLYFTVELPVPPKTEHGRYGDRWNLADRHSTLFIKRKGEDNKSRI
jgi:predicted dehydrogenase